MLTPITIQLVCPSDTAELLELSRKTFYDAFEHINNKDDFEAYTSVAFTREKLLSEIENPHSEFYFALIDDKKVGYIKLNYSSAQTEFQDEKGVEVERIYVLADQQGKQIGDQLLKFAINNAMQEKLHYIWLGVWEHNLAAQRFYGRNGFKPFSTHGFWIGNDKQIDLLMRKELI
jgi:diamine N-acetyltransferase